MLRILDDYWKGIVLQRIAQFRQMWTKMLRPSPNPQTLRLHDDDDDDDDNDDDDDDDDDELFSAVVPIFLRVIKSLLRA